MHNISHWLDLHDLEQLTGQDIVAAFHSKAFAQSLFEKNVLGEGDQIRTALEDQQLVFQTIVCPALASGFADTNSARQALNQLKPQTLDAGEHRPHTVATGVGGQPVVAMTWAGGPRDVMCLAHEAAHGLQVLLSDRELMPPVARETCAFIGELLLINHMRQCDPVLFQSLTGIWKQQTAQYLGKNMDDLSFALGDMLTAYHYDLNYPFARIASTQLFQRGSGDWIDRLFSSGADAMKHLPLDVMANRAGDIPNHLPPMPPSDAAHPAVEAYRSLGAMALLDIDHWHGECERNIEDYYARLLGHLHDRTAFLVLDEARRPAGYATWIKTPSGQLEITRQAAPFGGYLSLQKSLERHLADRGPVSACHPRSARQEQVAW
ncbi:hypothetical protein [uncultured Tateyamaria sp.]|uniref:hypothetical protein n=1 Tax=uncultured Tateyamaria sp. TaxID=455651 RepID=UPI00261F5128|nr:hypothetical protein [uncultured Tateyamaria sp.]